MSLSLPAAAPPGAAIRRHRLWFFAVPLLVLAGGAWGLGQGFGWGGPQLVYETQPAARRDLENTVPAAGKIEPFAYVDVGAQVSGRLDSLQVAVGDTVTAGQPLALIDTEVQVAQIEGLEAGLASLTAGRGELEAQLAFTLRQLERHETLQGRAATVVTLEEAQRERDILTAQIAGKDAEIRRAEAELRAERASLDQARITAPMAGTVIRIDAREGQTLNANYDTPVILRIADLATMTVRAGVSEADVAHLSPGMAVWFSTLGAPGRRHEARLRQILPAPEEAEEGSNTAVSFTVLFDVPNPDGALMPGMTAQVFFVTEAAPDALAIPAAALEEDGSLQVLVGGQPETRHPETGMRTRAHVQILSGVSEGEEVVTATREEEAPSLLRLVP